MATCWISASTHAPPASRGFLAGMSCQDEAPANFFHRQAFRLMEGRHRLLGLETHACSTPQLLSPQCRDVHKQEAAVDRRRGLRRHDRVFQRVL